MSPEEAEQRSAVVAEARRWVGTPFHYGACLRQVGVACGPFLLAVHEVWHIEKARDLTSLAKDWHFHTKEEKFLSEVKKFCHQVAEPDAGDAILFRLGSKDRPYSHGAIIVDWPTVIHAHFRGGVEYADVTKDVLLQTASEMTFWSPWPIG